MINFKCGWKYNVEELSKWIKECERKNPKQLELYLMKAEYYLLQGKYEDAYAMAKKGVRKNPYNRDINFMMRKVCEACMDYIQALKYDVIVEMIQKYFQIPQIEESHFKILEELVIKQGNEVIANGDADEIREYQAQIDYVMNHMEVCYGLMDETYGKVSQKLIGKYYEDDFGNRKYNAIYSPTGLEENLRNVLDEESKQILDNWISTKIECREVVETREYQIEAAMQAAEYLMPVLSSQREAEYIFKTGNMQEYACKAAKENHFNYYRVPASTKITSENVMYVGKPIPLKPDTHKKKLVLNIFLDGLSQKVLEEEGFSKLMPCSYEFFSKGTICENAYTCGEWTLPSIASYVTGLQTVNHMLIHNELTCQLPEDITLLQEYFKEQGYQTAKIDGEWRSTQSYGYGRGIDRIVYQHQGVGMRTEQVIADTLDHIKLMKETNQFVWMCVGDLHDIADGFEMPASIQGTLDLESRISNDRGITSVKQQYSRQKRATYIEMLGHIDMWLGVLYRYIENHYKDNEIVISMFGDHGQGYLVNKNEHFLSDGRTKVGMMFRGSCPQGICNELVSSCDYSTILCKLAGIDMKEEVRDGVLPAYFGGEKEREYVIVESIHPGDPYMAMVKTKENTLYFSSEGNANYDGRVELGNYEWTLMKSDDTKDEDTNKEKAFMKIIFDHMGSIIRDLNVGEDIS